MAERLEHRRVLAATPVISEFLAANSGGLEDVDGESSDWIEVYNPTNSTVDLALWRLTDDVDEPDKWVFPATTLGPSESVVVFASGKDRAVSGAELHTNFQLNSGGEYLALVDPTGAIASQYAPEYPEQSTNVSYGLQFNVETLVAPGSPAKTFVPIDSSLGNSWQQVSFIDSSWIDGPVGVGYGVIEPGFDVRYVKAQASGSFNGTVNSLTLAESVLATPAYQSFAVTERADVINFLGTGGGGNYGGNNAFPTQTIGEDINHFVIEATATIEIPSSGVWSFGVNSDDGFGLTLSKDGIDYVSSFPGTRGANDTIASFDLPTSGQYEVRLVMFEAAGGASVEFFAAPGFHSTFNTGSFDLVGDTTAGGLAAFSPYTLGQSPWVMTDIQSPMSGINSSAYLRVPFQVNDASSVETLTLSMRHDDGFVAYINGVEVARQNAPASPMFNSSATSARSASEVLQASEIVLGENAISALQSGNNVLSIQGLNASTSDPSFLIHPELISTRLLSQSPSFFATPTPGELNQDPVLGVLDRVVIDLPAGFYDSAQTVQLGSPDPVAQIVYTTDGSEPSATNGTIYDSPITVDSTTTLRAIAVATDYISLPSVTRTYLFLDDVLTQANDGSPPPGWPSTWGGNVVDYGIDPDVIALEGAETVKQALLSLPTLSLTTDLDNLFDSQIGIYSNAQQDGRDWERPVSAEWLNPDGEEGFQINAGLRIRGGFSRSNNNPKHALKLFFRGSYGDSKLEYPVHGDIGVSEFKKLDLRTAQNYSWSFQGNASNNFVAEVMARYHQRDLGQPYTRSTWIHLYLNGQYWGMYQTQERAEANFAESYFGGDAENYDVLKPERGAYRLIATDGNFDAFEELWQQAIARAPDGITPAFQDHALYMKAQGKNPDGSENLSYPVLLDVDNLIVYMLETLRGGNLDAPISNFLGNDQPNNYFAIRDRTGREGFRYFQHDAEHTMRNVNENRNGPWNAANFEGGVDYFNPQWLHQQLMANEEYRMRFADTVQHAFFNEGPLSETAIVARLNEEVAKIDQAVIAESARWGDAKRGNNSPRTRADFLNAIAGLRNNYLPNRNPIVLEQFRNTDLVLKDETGAYTVSVPAPLFPSINAPAFLIDGSFQHGGQITDTSELRFDSPDGLVYYMTDGTDPRMTGGGIHPNATVFDPQQVNQTMVASGQDWKFLDNGTQPPSNWNTSSFDDSAWGEGPSQLGYGDGDEATVVSFGGDSQQKHVTTYFRKEFNVDLSGGQPVSATIRVRRDDGLAVYLNGVEVVRDNLPNGTLNSGTFASSVVGGASESQWFEFSIDPERMQNGTNIIAAELHQVSQTSSDITFDLELIVSTQAAPAIPLNQTTQIRARTLSSTGEWSALNDALFQILNVPASPDNLRLTEINYNPAADGDAEFLELTNVTSGENAVTIDLDSVVVTDGPSVPYTIPNGTTLLPGQSALLVRDTAAFLAAYPGVDPGRIAGEYGGGLANGGERIRVEDATGAEIADLSYGDGDPWPKWADGVGGSLVLKNPADVPVEETGKPYHYVESVEFGGSPGSQGQMPFGVRINEILAHTDTPLSDSIELFNPTDSAIAIGGWFLSDDGEEPKKYKVPSGTTIPAGGFVVFDEDDFNPALPNADSLVPFALNSSSGDSVWLFTGNGVDATGFEDHVRFDATFNGSSQGLIPGSGDRLVPLANRSLGILNGTFEISPVVISEVHYHPADPTPAALAVDPSLTAQDLEFIELQNASSITVDLQGWRLRGEADYDFIAGDQMVTGESLIVVSFDPDNAVNAAKLSAFRQTYSIDASVRIEGPFSGSMSNSHGIVKLQAPDDPPIDDPLLVPRVMVDEVFYDDLAPWPTDADGTGASLQRLAPSTLGNYHDSWVAESPTPGNDPVRPTVQSITVNQGDNERSQVSQVTVTFDSEVTVSADSFQLVQRETGMAVENLQLQTQVIGGKTVADLSFVAGPLVISRPSGGNSLMDGTYQLRIVSDNVVTSSGGVQMAFDDLFGDDESDSFYRLYGDANGDRIVDVLDLRELAATLNKSSSQAGFDSRFDHDGDGDVDGLDYSELQRNMLRKALH